MIGHSRFPYSHQFLCTRGARRKATVETKVDSNQKPAALYLQNICTIDRKFLQLWPFENVLLNQPFIASTDESY